MRAVSRRDALAAMAGLGLLGCRAIERGLGIATKLYPAGGDQATPRLLVILAGATDGPEEFAKYRAIETLRSYGCADDIVLAYKLAPSYVTGELVTEIHAKVVRAFGERERRVWLTISAGGLVGFDYARVYTDTVDRIISYAPYLGPKFITKEIAAVGGLELWEPNEPIERVERIWEWLSGYAREQARPPLDLLWGRDDPNRAQIELLADVLPVERRHRGEGEHGWMTFMALLDDFAADHDFSDL